MAVKRTATVVSEDIKAVEPRIGGLASYYDNGWRHGYIEEIGLDDEGEYVYKIRPLGHGRRKKGKSDEFTLPRLITSHAKDTKLEEK